MVRPASSSVRVTESRGVRARGSRGPPRPGGRGQSSVPAEFLRERDAMAEQHTTLGVTAMDRGRAGRESPPLTGPAQGYRMRVCLRDVPPPYTHTRPSRATPSTPELSYTRRNPSKALTVPRPHFSTVFGTSYSQTPLRD